MRITLHVSNEGRLAAPLDFEQENITIGRSPIEEAPALSLCALTPLTFREDCLKWQLVFLSAIACAEY